MASMQHEGLLLLFRNRPRLAPELLRDALGVSLPTFREARIESAELTEVVPTEYRADLVVLLRDAKPVYAIVVEVQLGRDDQKRNTWPLYLVSLRSRIGCPTSLLVVAPDAGVARWCARPIDMGHPGFVLRPLVLGPEAVPVVTDAGAAKKDPELAVLSAMAHGTGEQAVTIANTAMEAARGLDGERARLYSDLVVASLGDAARSALERLMQSGTYEYESDFARRIIEQGLRKGLQKGEAESVLAVLSARGVSVPMEARRRIRTCADLKQLRTWLKRAAKAETIDAVFADRASRAKKRPAAKRVAAKR